MKKKATSSDGTMIKYWAYTEYIISIFQQNRNANSHVNDDHTIVSISIKAEMDEFNERLADAPTNILSSNVSTILVVLVRVPNMQLTVFV